MRNKSAWWYTLIGAVMVIYWVASALNVVAVRWSIYSAPLYVAVVLAVASAASVLKDAMRQPGEGSPRTLAPAVEPFVLAWHRLWSTSLLYS